MPRLVVIVLMGLLITLGACSAPESSRFAFDEERYEQAFDAARETLMDERYQLDRVDASAGVITTQRKVSLGLIAPWDSDQRTLGEEWRDFTNRRGRIARVEFVPMEGGLIEARVGVMISRQLIRGHRPETEAVGLATRWIEPGISSVDTVPVREDDRFAAVLAHRIERRMARTIEAMEANAQQTENAEPDPDPASAPESSSID